MPRVEVLVSDPRARTVDTATGKWVVAGVAPARLATAVRSATDAREARRAIASAAEDTVAVRVGGDRVEAFRSVTATRELYHCRPDDDTLVVTDQFRNALARLPVEERTVPDRTVTDHLLFRVPIEPDSYVAQVGALGRGAWLRWDGGEPTTRRRQTLAAGHSLDPVDAPDEIEARLDAVLGAGIDDDVTTMFSGGVDSTLLQTYVDAPTASMRVDSPELGFERRYVRETRQLLDTDAHRTVEFAEADFLRWLEESMDLLAFPSHFTQTVVTQAFFARDDGDRYLNGEGADALFGLSGAKGARIAAWLRPLLARTPASVASGVPGRAGSHVAELRELATRFDRPVTDARSFAHRFAFFTDPDVVGEMVGHGSVARRVRAQHDYVADRVEHTAADPATAHLELGHLLSFFQHNTVNQWRQLAHGHGKTLVAPFKTTSLASCALDVPPDRRYVQGPSNLHSLQPKYLLKRLLERRLPAYPTDREKGAGALPVERYFTDGSLADVFERYEPPAFVPDAMRADHVESFGPVTWNLVTYAVWRDRVLRNAGLDTVPGTRRYEVSL